MDHFRFECIAGCVRCCERKGYVYLSEEDLVRAAAYLGMSAPEFEARYIHRTRRLLRLRKPRRRECVFLEPAGCAIHPAKPTQCRAFPFWPELVGKRREWNRVARWCPGMSGACPVTPQAAIRIANDMRESYPGLYK